MHSARFIQFAFACGLFAASVRELPAQLATSMLTIPPVSRPLYITESRADSASYAQFRRLMGDTIVYMGLVSQGTFTERMLPLASIGRIEMAELVDWQEVAQRGAIFGGLAGVALGGGGGAMSGGSVAKPAIIGALAGGLVGYILGGQSAQNRVQCWRTIYQTPDADSTRLASIRRNRSPEPSCSSASGQ